VRTKTDTDETCIQTLLEGHANATRPVYAEPLARRHAPPVHRPHPDVTLEEMDIVATEVLTLT
jgi:hypothetical protein